MEMAKQQQQQQGKGRGMGGGGGGPAPFLVKTYEMVEEEGTEAVVSWGTEGASFIVWKPVEFARDLLPARFKHNNFSSFVRQLNTYGFRKVVPDRWEFANDNFRRGQRAMLSEIRRRKPPPSSAAKSPCAGGGPPSSTSNSGEVHSPSSTSSSPPPAKQQLLQLSSENEKLKNDNRLLSSQLEQAKKHCEDLLGFLSGYMDVSELNISLSANDKEDNDDEEEQNKECNDEDDDEEETQETVKLFGVVMRRCNGEEEQKKRKKAEKRPRCNERDGSRPTRAPWRTETAFKC